MLKSTGFQRFLHLTAVLIFVISLTACSGSTDTPVMTEINTSGLPVADSGGRMLWGLWEGYIPPSHDSLELVPVRSAEIHLNARRFLEYSPCTNCLTLANLLINSIDQTITATIQLRHPFPGLDKFTGFNVRSVIISYGMDYFPTMDVRMPDADLGDFTLLNPDGWTRLWNTAEYPEGSGAFPILEYSKGNLATPGEFSSRVNPFVSFSDDSGQRMQFPAGDTITRELVFNLTTGGILFGYAIDASWDLPTVNPPVNIEDDFPASANAMEPVFSTVKNDVPLTDTQGSESVLSVVVTDFQGWETIDTWELECPDLFTGVIDGAMYSSTEQPYSDLVEASFLISNDTGAQVGTYDALVKVTDLYPDPNLGNINEMYHRFEITVEEDQPDPEFEGEIIFVAPGPPDPGGMPGASNVYIYDCEMETETIQTDFFGVGYLWHEPRLNPAGTHHLHCNGPTPWYGNVRVYEFGGSDWTISTDEVDDFAAFHPDGTHIICASGTMWGETPDLYMMEYDGSNRTKLATASSTINRLSVCPDGNRVVMTQNLSTSDPQTSELWIYDISGDSFSEIMSADGADLEPCWSPVQIQGEYLVVYASTRDNHPDADYDIFVVNPVTQEILYKLDTGVSERHPSFSPDGLSFVYMATPEGQDDTELFICTWVDDEIVQLTDDDTYDGSPWWGWNW